MRGLTILLFALLLTSCASIPVYSVRSGEEDIEYKNGKIVMRKLVEGVETILVLEPVVSQELNLLAVVKNRGTRKVTLDSENFYVEVETPGGVQRISAMDPETEIRRATIEMARAKETSEKDREVDAVEDIANLIVDVVEGNHFHPVKVEARRAEEERRNSRDQAAAEKVERISEEISWLSNDFLRKSTVLPGQRITGDVRFPWPQEAGDFTVVFRLGDSSVRFQYKVTELKR
jgi:hypothetical protein